MRAFVIHSIGHNCEMDGAVLIQVPGVPNDVVDAEIEKITASGRHSVEEITADVMEIDVPAALKELTKRIVGSDPLAQSMIGQNSRLN